MIMGKRKQECPRKLSSDESKSENPADKSKLESIVKKLKKSNIQPPPRNKCPEAENEPKQAIMVTTRIEVARNVVTRPQVEPLDLRLPKFVNNNTKCLTVERISPVIAATKATTTADSHYHALDLSQLSRHVTDEVPTTTSFQELSAKLEEYFSTGIVASNFPRKMVRGQDIWMQDIEQKRAILKCLKCGASYNTLAELAKHIKKSGHHDDLSFADMPTKQRICLPLPRSMLASNTVQRHLLDTTEKTNFLQTELKITRVPSAFKPVKKDQLIKEFHPKNSAITTSSCYRMPGCTPFLLPQDIQPHSTQNGLIKIQAKQLTSWKDKQKVHNEGVSRKIAPPVAKKEGSDSYRDPMVERTHLSPTTVIIPDANPLFALKKFLDFGIPRLKPTGIDGGRI